MGEKEAKEAIAAALGLPFAWDWEELVRVAALRVKEKQDLQMKIFKLERDLIYWKRAAGR